MESTHGPHLGRAERESLFLGALPHIDWAVRHVARRYRLNAAEEEDFGSETKLALIDNDYAILTRFEGRSSLRAYLLTVVQRRFLDRRRKTWGTWRPSPAAQRLGPRAQRLEVLLYRERLPLPEAIATLRAQDGDASEGELMDLAQRLPARVSRRVESLDEPQRPEPPARDERDPLASLHDSEVHERCQAALQRAVQAMSPDDRVVLRLCFEDGLKVADIARVRGLDQKKLYRRLEALVRALRRAVEEQGLTWADVGAWIERGQCHLRLPIGPAAGLSVVGPSSEEGRGD
jgi:RNA polymerase sigma factor (sigma-70 family)